MGAKKNCAEEIRADMEALNYDVLYHNVSELVKTTAAAVGNSLSTWEDRKVIKPAEISSQHLPETGEEADAADIRYGKDLLCGSDRGADRHDVYG